MQSASLKERASPFLKGPNLFPKVSWTPLSQRYQHHPFSKVSTFSQRFQHPFLKGISSTFSQRFQPFPKVSIHGITNQAQEKNCLLLTRDVPKFYTWALLFCIACLIWHQGILKTPIGTFGIQSLRMQSTKKLWGSKIWNSQLDAERCGTCAPHGTRASLLQGPSLSKSCMYPRTLLQRSWHPCTQLLLGSHQLCCRHPQAAACSA